MLFASALLTLNLFAAEPTVTDLSNAGYDATDNVVLCINYPNINPVCFDVYAVGSFTTPAWDLAKTTDNKKFAELADFPGWYVVEVPYVDGLEFKPIIASDPDGNLSWDYQPGTPSVFVKVAGEDITLEADNAETKMKYTKAGFSIYKINSLKNDANPCTARWHTYTLNIYAPDCEYVTPTIAGSFNNWTDKDVPMIAKMDDEFEIYYTITVKSTEGAEFKVKGNTGWGNPLQRYIVDEDRWEDYPASGNLAWPEVAGVDTTIVWDCTDETLWRWSECEEPVECDSVEYTVTVTFPACEGTTPAIIGDFPASGWEPVAMTATATPNVYTATVKALCTNKYKFCDAVTKWENEPIDAEGKGISDMSFGEEAEITLDYSEGYIWKACAEPQAIGHVFENARIEKVIENGQLIIKVDGVRYTTTGARL